MLARGPVATGTRRAPRASGHRNIKSETLRKCAVLNRWRTLLSRWVGRSHFDTGWTAFDDCGHCREAPPRPAPAPQCRPGCRCVTTGGPDHRPLLGGFDRLRGHGHSHAPHNGVGVCAAACATFGPTVGQVDRGRWSYVSLSAWRIENERFARVYAAESLGL